MYSTKPKDSKKCLTEGRPNPSAPASGIPSSYAPGVQVPGRPVGNWTTRLSHCIDQPANVKRDHLLLPLTFGQIAEIVNRGSASCIENAVLYGVVSVIGLGCMYSCLYRSRLRVQYDLEEEPCPDCLVHFCCEPCALCQEYRELQNRGFDMGIGWEANMDRQRRGVTASPIVAQAMTR